MMKRLNSIYRIAEMRKQKASMHKVELIRVGLMANVHHAKVDVGEIESFSFLTRQIEFGSVDVRADDLSSWSNTPRQLERNVSAATTHIETDHALGDSNL